MIQYLSSRTHIPRVTFNCTFKHEKKSTGSDRKGAFSNGSVSLCARYPSYQVRATALYAARKP